MNGAQPASSYGTQFVFEATGVVAYSGAGSPEGAQVGNVGDLYVQADAGSGETALWHKATGTATATGWEAVGGSAGPSVWTQAAGVLSPTTSTDVVRAAQDMARTVTTGDVTLTDASPRFQFLVLDADRGCVLPSPRTGMAFMVKHAGVSYVLTVNDDGSVALALLAPGESAMFIYDGTEWQVL